MPGPVVTDAPPGYSYHNYGLAIDIVPLWRIGPIEYRVLFGEPKYFTQMSYIASELGIRNPIAGDAGHFQYTGGVPLFALRTGTKVHAPPFEPMQLPKILQRAQARLSRAGIIPPSS